MENNNLCAKINILAFANFRNIRFWDYYTLSKKNLPLSNYELIPLSKCIKQRKDAITIDNNTDYKLCRVQLYGNGIVLRGIVKGSEIKTKKQQLCKENDFLVAEIDAKFGGYGIVPNELSNAIVSSHYFIFEIDNKVLSPDYLGLVVKCAGFSKQVKATGSTNYAAIRPFHVLNYVIPLPSLYTQDKFVTTYNAKIDEALALENKADSLEIAFKEDYFSKLSVIKIVNVKNGTGLQFINFRDVSRWAISHIMKYSAFSMHNTAYKVVAIREVLSLFEGGKTPSKSRDDYWVNGNVRWASPKDFNGLYLFNTQDKITASAVEESKMKIYPQGTILGVFRSGILRHSFPVVLTQVETSINQDLKAMSPDNNKVDSLYLLFYLNLFQGMILERASKVGVTVESINVEEFLEIPIILPSLDVQINIAKEVKAQKDKISDLRSSAIKNRKQAIKQFEKTIFN